jgi:hypothetical protein
MRLTPEQIAEALNLLQVLSERYLANPTEGYLDDTHGKMPLKAFVACITPEGQDNDLFRCWRKAYDLTHDLT